MFAQEDDGIDDNNDKIRDKMNEYIQKRLNVSKEESAKFSPAFLRYYKEWRATLKDNKGDRLLLQKKIVDLRLKYRTEFREIIGEKRGDQVFNHQEAFIRGLKDVRRERVGEPVRQRQR